MNEYQKALDKLCELGRKELTFREICEMEIAVEILQELVEKATPKKVLKRETNGQEIKIGNGTFKLANMWYCPSCKNWISPSTSVNNCGNCGQALDWKVEEPSNE